MIHIQDVSVAYPKGIQALSGVDLHFERGEFAFITGASGSGKSTLLQLIYRELEPTRGQVIVDGHDVSQLPRHRVPLLRRKVGVVFQDFRLLPMQTVWENVGFALDVIGATKRDKHHRVPLVLELVGLADRADAYPDQLSGGEQQRVCIARALVNTPPLLLADEPTGNLDPVISLNIVQLLCDIADRGTTVLCATHDTHIVDAMQRRVVALVQGVVVRDEKTGGSYDAA
ncbi:MAG: cell division ATP-binding protein FtsE [candidate division WS1 bacterium]|nr:cell division ATP-binding protein FtsE [candidate division WS1 bacterium]